MFAEAMEKTSAKAKEKQERGARRQAGRIEKEKGW